MEEKVFQTRVAKIWQREDGIAVQSYIKDTEINLDDLKEVIEIGNKYFKQKNLIFVDISEIKSLSYEARAFLKNGKASQNVKAMAVNVKSKISTIIGNFVTYVTRPDDYPTKLFTNEEKAIEWLKRFE